MNTRQQEEALDYFKKFAEEWGKKAVIDSEDRVNMIKQRNDFVLKVIDERKGTQSALDVGCGTGDLIYDIARRGISAVGVDFSQEMIDIAASRAKEQGLDKASFECCSIFDYSFGANKFDVISANGFIEYISYGEFDNLLKISKDSLTQGGSLVLGSRNRLFNIFSLNKFTEEEVESGEIKPLLLEAIQLVKSENIQDLIGFNTAPLQKENKEHATTGVKVTTRYQFTPAQLINKLKGGGFEPIEIAPIHIHGVTPKFKEKNPAVHGIISNLLHKYTDGNLCLIPQASSFMIHCKKV